jgi:hypothetical protein
MGCRACCPFIQRRGLAGAAGGDGRRLYEWQEASAPEAPIAQMRQDSKPVLPEGNRAKRPGPERGVEVPELLGRKLDELQQQGSHKRQRG